MRRYTVGILASLAILSIPYQSFGAEQTGNIKICRQKGLIEMSDRKSVVYHKGWTFTSLVSETPKIMRMEREMGRLQQEGKSAQKVFLAIDREQSKLYDESFDVKLLHDAILGPKPSCAVARVQIIRGREKRSRLLPQESTPGATLEATPVGKFN